MDFGENPNADTHMKSLLRHGCIKLKMENYGTCASREIMILYLMGTYTYI